MKIPQRVLFAALTLMLVACTDRDAQKRAINEDRAVPAQVATPAQDAEPPFAATCREAEGRWDGPQQLCFVTAATCSNSAGTWEPASGCVLELPEAECDTTLGMVFEDSKCLMRTVSPKAFEV